MHRLKVYLFIGFLATTAFATVTSTSPTTGGLKNTVATQFLQQANDPVSILGQTIAQIISDSTDGRNPDGSISLPIKKDDFDVITLTHEEITNPWHYASKEGVTCTTANDETQFLVLLKSRFHVHLAAENEKVLFAVGGRKLLSREILNNSTDYCDDPNGQYSPVTSVDEVDGFQWSEVVAK